MTAVIKSILFVAAVVAAPSQANIVTAGQVDPAMHFVGTSCGFMWNMNVKAASVEPDTLPCGSWAKIVDMDTGETVTVEIVDVTEAKDDGLTILLTSAAADMLRMKETAKVVIVPLKERP